VECLDVPAAWILHSAGWPATVGEHGIELGSKPNTLRSPLETAANGPLFAVREAIRALPPSSAAPATLVTLPSPATLAMAAGAGRESEANPLRVSELKDWSRAVLQALVRSLGELDVLAGVMFDGEDGAPALGRLLDHYQLTPVCIRLPADTRPLPQGALGVRALSLEALAASAVAAVDDASETLVTTDGPVSPLVVPEELLRASRTQRGLRSD
jgi:hypothetical protein